MNTTLPLPAPPPSPSLPFTLPPCSKPYPLSPPRPLLASPLSVLPLRDAIRNMVGLATDIPLQSLRAIEQADMKLLKFTFEMMYKMTAVWIVVEHQAHQVTHGELSRPFK